MNPSNTGGSRDHSAQLPIPNEGVERAIEIFVSTYNTRSSFFADKFISRIKEGHRKTLAELTRNAIPPTPMDLREALERCVKEGVADECIFSMKDGKSFSFAELKALVPLWALIAEQALIESDPALADKLMSREQWNARVAFEVAFVNAMNELESIDKIGMSNNIESYMRWTVAPLTRALENVKTVRTPGNTMIGYTPRLPLSKAIAIAETIESEFRQRIRKM